VKISNADEIDFQMSPVYKELLLKLVMSMSRDELFIRSKNIMDQEKMKNGGLKPNSNLDALALLQQTATAAPTTAPPTVTKSSGFGSLLGFRKPFLSRKTAKTEAETKTRCQFHQYFTYDFFVQLLLWQHFLRTCN